jgi:hypothetical protein
VIYLEGQMTLFFMSKLFVLPLMVATLASITGGTVAEAKPRMFHDNPGGNPGTIHRPRKRCTFKRPCSRMPELPDFGTPMPRGGLRR